MIAGDLQTRLRKFAATEREREREREREMNRWFVTGGHGADMRDD